VLVHTGEFVGDWLIWRQVENSRDMKRFIRFPFQLYKKYLNAEQQAHTS